MYIGLILDVKFKWFAHLHYLQDEITYSNVNISKICNKSWETKFLLKHLYTIVSANQLECRAPTRFPNLSSYGLR